MKHALGQHQQEQQRQKTKKKTPAAPLEQQNTAARANSCPPQSTAQVVSDAKSVITASRVRTRRWLGRTASWGSATAACRRTLPRAEEEPPPPNQLNATELLVAKIKEGSLEAAEAEKRKGASKGSTKERQAPARPRHSRHQRRGGDQAPQENDRAAEDRADSARKGGDEDGAPSHLR